MSHSIGRACRIGWTLAPAEHPEEVRNFTIQGCPVRHREKGLTRFVAMRGGAYLFMPSLKALEYLAKMP